MEADMRNKLLVVLVLSGSLAASVAMSQNESQPPPGDLTLGEVNFPISCSEPARQQFNRAVAILHSFWYEEAEKAFTSVTNTDATCVMGYWGVAMSNWHPMWFPPTGAELKAGSNAVAKASALGSKTDRERDYIEAIAAFYRDSDKLDNRTRSIAYEKAMEQVYLRYPDDREGAIFYALALNATAPPTDKTFANQKRAAQILNKIFIEQPNHPGIAHYLIHSYDSAPLAALGLPAAICYAKIAPSVPHALHMPSHIFTRLGKWQDSVEANRASLAAGQDYAVRQYGEGVAWDQSLHAMDYLEYAYLQLGQDHAAKRLVDEIVAFRKTASKSLPAAYAIAAIPARYAVERRDWLQAANLSPPPLAFDWDAFPWTKAMITYARALGAARTGDVASAQIEIEHLQAVHDSLIGRDSYWADQIEVQRLAATAMLAHAQGKVEEALAGLRQAGDLEASMEKHPVTPGGIVPMRELLGDLLLEVNQPAQALIAYEQTLSADPNRFRSVYGAAKAADRAGDPARAKAYYQQLAVLGSHADAERPELAEAKVYLGQ
jgi:tetratricopeptide (TPR) repeat protein